MHLNTCLIYELLFYFWSQTHLNHAFSSVVVRHCVHRDGWVHCKMGQTSFWKSILILKEHSYFGKNILIFVISTVVKNQVLQRPSVEFSVKSFSLDLHSSNSIWLQQKVFTYRQMSVCKLNLDTIFKIWIILNIHLRTIQDCSYKMQNQIAHSKYRIYEIKPIFVFEICIADVSRCTVPNITLKVTSYFIVFSVKNLILWKIHINVFTIFLMPAWPFLLVVINKTKLKKSSNCCC